MMDKVGILAYGSLMGEPGPEIGPSIIRRIPCITHFNVEFARASKTRTGGPTLVPYEAGAQVAAQVLVVDMPVNEAMDRLYRRETRKIGTDAVYALPKLVTQNTVVVEAISAFEGVQTVLYTRIGANIEQPSATKLAERAIESARARTDGSDGISYLINAINCGIRTPLSPEYEREILRLTGADSLVAALDHIRR
jgi:hypothetical protein